MQTLITGITGMLGSYLLETNPGHHVTGLSRHSDGNEVGIDKHIGCDLKDSRPACEAQKYDLVIHCAGGEVDNAAELNRRGIANLLTWLESTPPSHLILVSSAQVYGDYAQTDTSENATPSPSSIVAKSKLEAERIAGLWCQKHQVALTILRPAPMFGNGIHGEMQRLFEEVARGTYVHLRGNKARKSIVTAYDAAKAIWLLGTSQPIGPKTIYNIADPIQPTLLELTEAMSANLGARKRMWHLPPKWAGVLSYIPGLRKHFNREKYQRRQTDRTFNSASLCALGWKPYNTLAVIAGEEKEYPYRQR